MRGRKQHDPVSGERKLAEDNQSAAVAIFRHTARLLRVDDGKSKLTFAAGKPQMASGGLDVEGFQSKRR